MKDGTDGWMRLESPVSVPHRRPGFGVVAHIGSIFDEGLIGKDSV